MKFTYQMDECPRGRTELLGSKGSNCAEMIQLGIPVPMGFIITTEAHFQFLKTGKLGKDLKEQIGDALRVLETKVGKKMGDPNNPLLVSVRSGAAVSMPGMMDTILNIGMDAKVEQGIAEMTGDAKFAKELHERLHEMYEKTVGINLPTSPLDQVLGAIKAVFKSWNSDRAVIYRQMNDISDDLGTAVIVQMMVFGNASDDSGTGVVFTRDPSTGEKILYGEYLPKAQGEDIVAGIRTPMKVAELGRQLPEIYNELLTICGKLEDHYKEMQDIEFTVERGKLFILQTRKGQRTISAALKIAADLVSEGRKTREQALLSIDANALSSLFHPTFDKEDLEKAKVLGRGLAASPGAAYGRIAFTSKRAKKWADEATAKGTKQGEVGGVILVRTETCADDIEGMYAAKGILTAKGGMTSHAAVVARGMGRTCIAGCGELEVAKDEKSCTINGVKLKEGDVISIDGTTGTIYSGIIVTKKPTLPTEFAEIMAWSDDARRLRVRTNADTPEDCETAIALGAEGIGLCRTEHMFFKPERLVWIRQMILAKNKKEREVALEKILPMQREDFVQIFKVMAGRPVTIRLLDPPLHEFAPDIESLHESNPMLGHRGVRLMVTYPEIAVMQTKAIIEAAIAANAHPEIMIPLTVSKKEFIYVKNIVRRTAKDLIRTAGSKITFQIGTMIETPRACLVADEIAADAEFFSFGTNDLTQMTYGFSRDDAGTFLPEYLQKKILTYDPFVSLDKKGVGRLVRLAIEHGKSINPAIKIGICGEHGGEVRSIKVFHENGLDYVSCSPYRIPTARLAAAQAAILLP